MNRLKPLKFTPLYQDYLWGGRRIAEQFKRKDTPFPCAESWEISDRPEGMSRVAEGPLAGTTLNEIVQMYGERLLGAGRKDRRFPLLIKIIDAEKPLSVQVHPSEESSRVHGGEPKTEMWYLLEKGPVYACFKRPLKQDELTTAIKNTSVEDLLQKIDVNAGEAVFIPGGRIHAIGEGCMMLEVQQNSNSTFRVYDWGRKGADGLARPLHIEEALQCLKFDDVGDPRAEPLMLEESDTLTRWQVLSTLFFSIEKMEIRAPHTQECDPSTFQIFFNIERGESTLLPADSESLELPVGTFIRIYLPPELELER